MREQPRTWAIPPSSFGRRHIADWRHPTPGKGADALLEAAVIQHVLAYRINDRRIAHGHTLDQAAFDMPMNAQRLGRLLRGELALTLDETIAWQHYLHHDNGLLNNDTAVRDNLNNVERFTGTQ